MPIRWTTCARWNTRHWSSRPSPGMASGPKRSRISTPVGRGIRLIAGSCRAVMPAGHCPTCVARWGHGETAANVPVTVVPGGDSYLNDARTKALCAQALKARPDAELIELDATSADQYAFDEAVSPSCFPTLPWSNSSTCRMPTKKLAEALVTYTKQAAKDPNGSSVVICQHEGGVKGRKIIRPTGESRPLAKRTCRI